VRDARDPVERSEPDDVDRLFARLDRSEVPEELMARVLASTVGRTEASRAVFAWPWMLAGLFALALLSLAGYQLGVSLAAGDGLELVSALMDDLGLVATAPGDVVAALGEVVPWRVVALAGVSAALLIFAVGNMVSRAPAPLRTRPIA
jgi:type VI protein secretion system component VasF